MNDSISSGSYPNRSYARDAEELTAADSGWESASGEPSAGDIIAVASELVEGQLRTRPIPTLLAALAAGWVIGRILR